MKSLSNNEQNIHNHSQLSADDDWQVATRGFPQQRHHQLVVVTENNKFW